MLIVVRTIVILGFVFSFASCGEKIREKQNDDLIGRVPIGDDIAVDYTIDDQECLQNGDGASNISETPVHVWQRGNSSAKMFSSVSSVGTLQGYLTHTTYYGYHQQNQCEYSAANGVVCGSGGRVISSPKRLRVCDAERSYSRNSVEGVGLSSIHNLERTHKFYKDLQGSSNNMKRSSLLVLPTVEKLYDITDNGKRTARKRVTTDNLAYAPSFIGSPTFVIFPKGKASQEKGLWRNLNLWEVPWALAHEYGHHVFRTHTGISSIEKDSHLFGNLLRSYFPEVDGDGLELAGRVVGVKDIWGSVNEGFADLYAHYSLGGQSELLTDVDCFVKNREVDSPLFLNGVKKIINSDVMQEFNSTSRRKRTSCSEPVFQDIHIMGAAIAHGVDRLLTIKAGDAPQAKAELLLKWAEGVGNVAGTTLNSNLTIPGLLVPMLEVVSADGTTLTAEQCGVISESFSAFQEEWITNGKFSCQ